ncbi:MAG: site-2 protease family protein [Caldilineaceae bacterium]
MNYLLTLLLISTLIFLHELGHLVAAKWCGIPIARFSVGFGRRLWSIQIGETEYCVSALPLGGYVLPAIDEADFQQLSVHHQVLFALGGPLVNFATALVSLAILFTSIGGLSLDLALLQPLKQTGALAMQILYIPPGLFGQMNELRGIVGIVATGGDYVDASLWRLLELSFLLNVNLAVFNLLPILPLDGGRIVMALFAADLYPAAPITDAIGADRLGAAVRPDDLCHNYGCDQADHERAGIGKQMNLAEQVAELCSKKSKAEQFSGAIIIRHDKEDLLRAAYGYANRAWQIPNRIDTRFRIASISKMFTAVAVLQLIEADNWTLDTRAVEHLGLDNTAISPEITVYHLLTMTSGMADWFDESTDDWEAAWAALCREHPIYLLRDNADYLPLFAHKPPTAAVGAKHQYNGAGYMLLGLLIGSAAAG